MKTRSALAGLAFLASAAVLLLPGDALAQRRFGRGRFLTGRRYVIIVPGGRTYVPAPPPPAPVVESGYPAPPADTPVSPPVAPAAESNPIRPAAAPAPDDADAAVLKLRFPTADAEFWVEGERVPGTGTARRFVSPPLKPGEALTLNCKARWSEDGRGVTEARKVEVYAGDRVTVDFRRPAAAEGPPEIIPKEYSGPRP